MKKLLSHIFIFISIVAVCNGSLQVYAAPGDIDCSLPSNQNNIECLTPVQSSTTAEQRAIDAQQQAQELLRVSEAAKNGKLAGENTVGDGSYHLLQPLPCKDGEEGCVNGKLTSFNPAESGKLGEYLNFGIRLFIGLCAVAAVVMIVVGGIEYATSELSHSKTAAKDRIYNAIFGLLLALGSYTILYTVNPDLLKTDFDVGGGTLTSSGEISIKELEERIITVGGPITDKNRGSIGTPCDANVIFNAAQSAGRTLTKEQAAAMGCIGGAESGGCKNVQANVTGVTSSASGPFQILGSNRTRLGNTTACKNNPSSLECNATIAAGLLLRQTNYRDWLDTQYPCSNAKCVIRFDPQKVDRGVQLPEWVKVGKNWVKTDRKRNPYTGCGL